MHIPVLLDEVIKYLDPKPGGKFIDATINGGGHALAIIERILPGGRLLGLEWDPVLYQNLKIKVQSTDSKVILENTSYVNLYEVAEKNDFLECDGILFDLGMSSWQIEESGRGFSFQKDEPLDMRFDPTNGRQTAAEIINKYSEDNLVRILKNFGEEKFAKVIAREIVKTRKERTIISTWQLVEIVRKAVPFWYRRSRIHFATRTFQALRIEVNHELENIEAGLGQAVEVLRANGRLAVISFHSLEDRIVKYFFREQQKQNFLKILTKKPVRANLPEITNNPRARSGKLRAGKKQIVGKERPGLDV